MPRSDIGKCSLLTVGFFRLVSLDCGLSNLAAFPPNLFLDLTCLFVRIKSAGTFSYHNSHTKRNAPK